jgi:DNA (cytosine-5)-methyltransferase 1
MKILSLFTGCGGLDLGFEKAGFKVVWANEYDKKIWETFRVNFPHCHLDTRSITDAPSSDMPEVVGIIGGPPCQSWSEAGAGRGITDKRGQLFFEYVRILKDKQPLFFLAENVSGMLFGRHNEAVTNILSEFDKAGYNVKFKLLNTADFGVPQDRKRVLYIGYRKDMGIEFEFPEPLEEKITLKDAIWDLRNSAKPAKEKNHANEKLKIPNHEYLIGGFSSMFLSRNRVRAWDGPSFTIQAGGRHAPIHPQANKMIYSEKDKFIFDPESPKPYRRMSVRECARIQTFPDDFIFKYEYVADGYLMIGNAVPVNFAKVIAEKIAKDIKPFVKKLKK